jgi:dienelactone hydrolase
MNGRRHCGVTWGILVCWLGAATASTLCAQDFQPPPAVKIDDATRKKIADKTGKLGDELAKLRRKGIGEPVLAEVEIYHHAAVMIVKHDEFFQKESAAWTLEALDQGLARGKLAVEGDVTWWKTTGRSVVRAYRSRIDESVQPFAVTFPVDYAKDPKKKWRLDVVLHGRDKNLNEVKFLHQHLGDKPSPKEQDFIKLDIYGRGNNAYRWAGESDIYEALDNFVAVERFQRREKLVDLDRFVLRGFSMGGAGTWHIGLHNPAPWCVLGPGAGFTSTHGYIKNLPAKLPDWQERCLRIYDAVDYAENAFNVPVVAYGGAKDPQLQAARNIEARLKPLSLPLKFQVLVAPDLEHKFPPEWQKKAEAAYAPHITKGRPAYPERVRFVTYTMKYPGVHWVTLLGLERHFERTLVDAKRVKKGFDVTTENVRCLRLLVPKDELQDQLVQIDGQKLTVRPWDSFGVHSIYLQKQAGLWKTVLPQRLYTERAQRPQKVKDLQGPIDDAFMDSFVCVRGTGKPWHAATHKHVEASLKRFQQEWNKYFRGDAQIKDDVDVNNEDIATRHLILFGDPASNSLIAQVIDSLPIGWTRESIRLAGKTYAAADHVPVMIYPSPLNSARYVVLNSGHTFHASEFQGTNAQLYPRLGDYAILRPAPTAKDALNVEVVTAGLFDDYWKVAP